MTLLLLFSGSVSDGIRLEMQFSGSSGIWTDVWPDVRMDVPVNVSYGISGVGPMDHIAETGTMAFALDNSQANSAKTLGYYAPGSASARSGFDIGIRTRLIISYSGSSFYKFFGTLQEATPEAGQWDSRRTHCIATDWMDEAANHQLKLIGLQTDQTTGQLISTIVGNVVRPPVASTISTGQDAIKLAGDTWQDENKTAYGALADITMSEWGYLYVKGDQTTGGVLQFDDRLARVRNTTVAASLTDETHSDMEVSRVRENILNRFNVQTHPRATDVPPATCTLYMLENSVFIAANTTASIVGNYTDPLEFSKRVGGGSMITPSPGTDWTFGSEDVKVSVVTGCDLRNKGRTIVAASNLSGINMSSALTVSTSYGANSVTYAFTNTCPNAHGYLTQLIARGRGLYDYNPMTYLAESASSQAQYGLRTLPIDLPLQSNQNVGADIANYLLSWYKTPQYTLNRVEFFGSTAALLAAGLQIEPGNRVSITESATGINQVCFVNGVDMEITLGNTPGGFGLIKFALAVYQADTTVYWTLDSGALGTDTVLGW